MQLHYQSEGQGPPLIILHGFLGSLDNFRSISKRLSENHTVYSVDLRNHGRSPHSDVMSYAVMAEDMLEFLGARDLSETAVLGHSMGGKVAMQLATSYPDYVGKLLVIDIAPKDYPPAQASLLEAMNRLDLARYGSFGEIDGALAPDVRDPATRRLVLKNVGHRQGDGFYWKIDVDAMTKNYGALAKNITPEYRFEKPACFIRGGRSKYIQDEDSAGIREIFPRAEIVQIPNAGHWVHADAPEEFLRTVRNFLGRPDAAST